MNSSAKITNLNFLVEFTKGNEEKIKRYIQMYLDTTSQVIAEMEEYLSGGNIESVALKAHSIKPQAQYMGAVRLSEALRQIEETCRNLGDTSQLAELIDKAKKLNERASLELSQFLQEM